jgi:hypothetical protein
MIRELDRVVSQIVRARGYCVACGSKDKLQCCHIYTRTFLSTRFHFHNLLCLCASCHKHFHNKPIEFQEFVLKFLGEEKYATLKLIANKPRQFTMEELEDLYARNLEILKPN